MNFRSMKKAEAPVTDLMMVSTSPKTDRESKIPDKEMVKEEDAAVLAHEEERETDHCDTDILDDDFDEFAEEQSGDDAEFGQFSQDAPQMTRPVSSRHPVFQPTDLAFPALQLDASAMDARTVLSITDTLLPCIFPSLNPRSPKFHAQPVYDSELPPFGPSPFLTPRSASLWEQLIAPPTLQPFSWTRSHVRRLFLISLGVAVDLDEILPKAPQKKLNLPSTSFAKDTARITAERDDGQGGASMDRDSGRIPDPRLLVAPSGIDRTSDGVITNSPSASPAEPTPASTSSTIRYKRRRGPPPPPKFEASLFRALCETTTTDLKDLSDTGLQEHAEQVYQARELAGEVLQYWNMRKAEASAEKEALEGVVENLVRHARSSRLGPGSKMKGRKKK